MRIKRYLNTLFIIMFVACSLLGNTSQVIAGPKLTDIDNHWAAIQIKSMIDGRIINGYPDNTFKPDHEITRAEFVTMVNKAYRFTATTEINYPDVDKAHWFAGEISKAKAAGYLSGYADGTMKPGNTITRQEAAVIIAKASKIDSGSEQELAKFKDSADIPEWSRGALAALTAKGYIGGYPDGTIKAARIITRAEAAVLLTKVNIPVETQQAQAATLEIGMELDKASNYGPDSGQKEVEGSVTISAAGVMLQHANISGDLLISEAVGDGDVTLKNVNVNGVTRINGGGANTVTIENGELGKTIINKNGGNIRVLLTGQTRITELVVDSAATVAGQAKIDKAIINADKVVIESKPDSFTIRNGVIATISGKTESGTAANTGTGSTRSPGSSDGYTLPIQVDSMVVNQLFGKTFVTVIIKADWASTVDEVFIGGEQAFTQDGISYKKTLQGSFARSAIVVAVKTMSPEEQLNTSLIVPEGCNLVYTSDSEQSRVQVQTSASATAVTANDNDMQKIDGTWQCDLDGEVISVTVVATDGTNSETYILTESK